MANNNVDVIGGSTMGMGIKALFFLCLLASECEYGTYGM